eukprot:CAMPEP_0171503102 /NCGR_PEP_ID=MMETSP0958-20121227/10650_1 /TAXON_ID=87120 /ORGANISM="Aurantiochytrium limacinum, Strain ATCCMYA-1381" /LENGTH=257 /DNA_ID=CAMNT_0012038437 /DNA_START=147 /DNA_END=917 /DNA_ORIENTATION=-
MPTGQTEGILEIFGTHLRFVRSAVSNQADTNYRAKLASGMGATISQGKQWQLSTVRRVQRRRVNMRWTAMELFTGNTERESYLFDFVGGTDKSLAALKQIARLIDQEDALWTPSERALRSGAQEAWLEGRISNLEYLMVLNDYAGRTYEDLAQYPIIPWVLSSFSSETIDLQDPSFYRDLRFPIGAQSESRREELRAKFQEATRDYRVISPGTSSLGGLFRWPLLGGGEDRQFQEQKHGDLNVLQGPPWHFGSHYSS